MQQQYETANIIYKGLTDGKLTVTLLDDKKGKWTVWKKAYQSEEDSEPYQALQQFKFGDKFGVSYQEKDETFTNETGKVINFKKRTIYSILPTVTNPTSEMKTNKPQTAPRAEQTYQTDKQVDWQGIAIGKTQSLFLAAFIQAGGTFADAKLQVTQARQLAELVVNGTQETKSDDEPPLEDPGF